jgi:hypothetical protein
MGSFIFPGHSDAGELRRFMSAALGVMAFMVVFFYFCKVHDLATAMFFAFGLGLMARGKMDAYFALFAFASANRETSFLLAVVFAVYYLGRMGWKGYVLSMGYQVFLYGAIRLCLVTIFADHPGVTMNIRPIENMLIFLRTPVLASIHWGLFGLVVWACVRRWREHPYFVRVAFVVLLPALLGVYLVVGWPYEIRVFAEVWPVVWIMSFQRSAVSLQNH